MKSLYIIFLFIINLLYKITNGMELAPFNAAPIVNHHIKWISNKTFFPLKVSIVVNDTYMNDTVNWDWLRVADQTLISHSTDLFSKYLIMENSNRASLSILNYDNQNHELLSSYEPKLIGFDLNTGTFQLVERDPSNVRDVFTLAYLKSHKIRIDTWSDPSKISVSCYADFLISKLNNNDMIAEIIEQMERYSSFKISLNSKSLNRQSLVSVDGEELEQAPHKGSFFYIDQPVTTTTEASTTEETTTTTTTTTTEPTITSSQPAQFSPMFDLNRFVNRNMYGLPVMNPVIVNNNNNNPFPVRRYKIVKKVRKYRKKINRIERPYEPEDVLNRQKRTGELKDESDSYDHDRFVRVRLSLGPLILFMNPGESEERVKCSLDLINKDDVNLDYHSVIYEPVFVDKLEPVVEKESQIVEKENEVVEEDMKPMEEAETTTQLPVHDKKAEDLLFFYDSFKSDQVGLSQDYSKMEKMFSDLNPVGKSSSAAAKSFNMINMCALIAINLIFSIFYN